MQTPANVLRYLVAAVLIGVAMASGYFAVRAYQQQAELHLPAPQPRQKEAADSSVSELSAAFARTPRPAADFQVIAEKNLFSPTRTAWQSAIPDEETPAAKAAGPARRSDVVLYGVMMSNGERLAIVGFPSLGGPRTRFVLREGEAPPSPDPNSDERVYEIKTIGHNTIEVVDASGAVFNVGLFDHERSQPVRPASTAQNGQPAGPQVTTVTSTAPTPTPPPVPAQETAEQPAAAASSQGKTLTPGEIRALSQDEKERLVQEGQLRKINTPMGSVYRPVR